MNSNLSFFLAALGLACVLEALPCLIAPKAMQEALEYIRQIDHGYIRYLGLGLLAVGVFLVWLAR